MNDKKLIESVRKFPVLYDLSNPNYMDTEFKNAIWSEIGEEMESPSSLCKTRWSNIRDNFRKSLRKSKIVSDQNGKTMKRYKYSQQLSFLLKFFEKKDAITITDDKVKDQDFKGENDVSEPVSHKNEDSTQDCTTEVNNPVTVELLSHTSSNSKQTGSSPCPILQRKTKQSIPTTSPPKTVAATVMEYLIKKNESLGNSSLSPQHPVDAFLSGIAPVLKKLPPRLWHYAKADIFNTVQNYELNLLMDQKQHVETSLISMSPTPSYSGQPSPACPQESISTCSTPSFSEQPSPT